MIPKYLKYKIYTQLFYFIDFSSHFRNRLCELEYQLFMMSVSIDINFIHKTSI